MGKLASIGSVPDNWIVNPLSYFLERITYGFTNPMPTTKAGPWKVTAADVIGGKINYSTARHTSLNAYEKELTEKSKPRKNDVLLTKDGSIGRLAVVDRDDICINQSVAMLRPNNKIDPYFLKYLLQTPFYQWAMAKDADGSTILHIYITRIDKMELAVPPIDEQQRILDLVKTIDDKIELNHQMNQTLESMAQAVFRQWFVDGEDVETWEAVPLPEIIELNPTRSLKKGEVAPYLDMANMPTQGHRGIEWIDRPFGSGTKFINGDTLLARITPCLENGKTAFVDFLKDGQVGWGSTEYIIFCPKPPLPPEYGYYLARSEELRNHAIVNMTGTSGRQRTPASCFDNYLVSVPPEDLAKKFGEFAKSVIDKVRANDEESRTLASLRDTLLPKLMRGEVRVKNV